ncbi:unnamed protein product [Cunninghamella echinulata]
MNSDITTTSPKEETLIDGTSSSIQRSRNDGVVPDFIQKLFNMLENASSESCFHWGRQGTTFVIDYPNEFAKTILPKRFKHSNFSSFVRQLNKYDFHKLRFLDNKTSPIQSQAWEFQHPNFRRDKKHLLALIRRKTNRKPNIKSANNDNNNKNNKSTSSSPISSNTEVSSSMNQQQDVTLAMNQWRDILNGFQTQLNDLRHAQISMETTMNRLLNRDTLLMDQLNDLKKNIDERNNIISTLMDNKRFIHATSQNKNIAEDIAPTMPSPQSPSLKLYPWIQLPTISNNNNNSLQPSSRIISNTNISSSPITSSLSNHSTTSTATTSTSASTSIATNTNNITNDNNLNNINTSNTTNNDKNNKDQQRSAQPTCLLWNVKPKILVVEDNELYRKISERCLNRLGCTFHMACDGLEAISFMETNKYDLILMDISIPKLDGMEVTRKLRMYDQLTPVVSMTANYTEHDIDNYVGSGMSDLLPKPFDQSKLYDILKQHCSHLI